MIILSASGLRLSFGERTLFSDVSFDVKEGEKIGLIGVNGSGKTSLFKCITGELHGEGHISPSKTLALGYVEQHVHSGANSAYEEVLSIFAPMRALEAEITAVTETLALQANQPEKIENLEILVAKQHRLQERYEEQGGFTYKSRTRAALLGLGFSESMFNQPLDSLSGGEKSKVLLARMLLSGANLLLLDEPTNHLDIAGTEWLENYLSSYPGALLLISHDRYFLDKVTQRTFEIQNGKLKSFVGNYSVYMEKKTRESEIEARHFANTSREIKRIEGIVAQQRQWNRERNIRTAESKLKQIARLEKDLHKPESAPRAIQFHFHTSIDSGQDVLLAENLAKSFGEKKLFSDVDLHIRKGERVFLLGANGCGKSTLLKILLGRLSADRGQVDLGSNVYPGYYDQTLKASHPEKSVLDEVWQAHPKQTQTDVRNALAAFLFRSDDVNKPMSALSGGELARVALVKLMLGEANFLLLDEPTNHLDIASREVLETALLDYDGTQLIVSHDRYFVNKLADRILYLSPQGMKQFLGNYDDYLAQIKDSEAQDKEETNARNSESKNDYHLQKERKSEIRRLIGKRDRTEKALLEQEERIGHLENELCSPEISSDYQAAMTVGEELEAARTQYDALFEEWSDLQEQCERLEPCD